MHALGYFRLGRRRNLKHIDAPRLRLVLFGFAGGTVTALHSLAEALPSWIEVWGAEYPGRGMRWREDAKSKVSELVDDLSPGLQLLDDMPLAMLGYSMGAHVAFRLAHAIHPRLSIGLIVISARPPLAQDDHWQSASLSDAQLLAKLNGLGGIPHEILNNSAVLEHFLPVMRADLAVCSDFRHFPCEPLSQPIFALEGNEDRLLLDAETHRWLEFAGGEPCLSQHQVFSGGHFFHKGREQELALHIGTWLEQQLQQQIKLNAIDAASPYQSLEPVRHS